MRNRKDSPLPTTTINNAHRQAKARRAANNENNIRCCVEWHVGVYGKWLALALYSLSLKIAKKNANNLRIFHLSQRTLKAVLGTGSDALRDAIKILVSEGFWLPIEKGGIRQLPDGSWQARRRNHGKQLLADEYRVLEHKEWTAIHPDGCFDTMPLPDIVAEPKPAFGPSLRRDNRDFVRLFTKVRAEILLSTGKSVFFPRKHTRRLRKMTDDYKDDHVVMAAIAIAEEHCGPTFNWKGFSGRFLSVGWQLLYLFKKREEEEGLNPRLGSRLEPASQVQA